MKAHLILLLFLGSWLGAWGQTQPDSAWMQAHYIKEEVMIPMRDGKALFTSIYRPKTGSDHPILLTRTPYSSSPYGPEFRPWWQGHFQEYVKKGYILVIQDVRGRWRSEGQFVNIRPIGSGDARTQQGIDERTDSYDTIDWLLTNVPGNNGRVGVYGGSYAGFYTLMAALSRHPAIKAVNPQAPVTDWLIGDDFHHNGAFFLMDAFTFFTEQDKFRPEPTSQYDASSPYHFTDNYDFFLRQGSLKHISALVGDSIPFWKDLTAGRPYHPWWQARTVTHFLKDLRIPTLVTGSPYDAENVYGAWKTYEVMKKESPEAPLWMVMGPWYHMEWSRDSVDYIGHIHFPGQTSRWYARHTEYPFFHHFLLGEDNWKDPSGTAYIYISGENAWHSFPSWPDPGIVYTPIYLRKDGALSWEAPGADEGESTYVSDPDNPVPYTEDVHKTRTLTYMTDDQRFASRRPDVLVFETPELSEDLTLAGPVEVELQVQLSGTDADFVVKLIDVFPEDFSYGPDKPSRHRRITTETYPMGGYEMLIRGDVFRGKYRNSFDTPQPFTPGKTEAVKFTLNDIAHTFKKGHKLMIQVQSSWFPLVDRNPQQFLNIYQADNEDFIPARIAIEHHATQVSKLILPVLPNL